MPSPINWDLYDAVSETKKRQEAQEIALQYLFCRIEGKPLPEAIEKAGKKILLRYTEGGKEK